MNRLLSFTYYIKEQIEFEETRSQRMKMKQLQVALCDERFQKSLVINGKILIVKTVFFVTIIISCSSGHAYTESTVHFFVLLLTFWSQTHIYLLTTKLTLLNFVFLHGSLQYNQTNSSHYFLLLMQINWAPYQNI